MSATESSAAERRIWLQQAIYQGRIELVSEMLEVSPELIEARLSGNATPLLMAAYFRQHQTIEMLLRKGARIDFITAIALDKADLVRELSRNNPTFLQKYSPDSLSCLHVAAKCASPEMLSFLISTGADVNERNNPRKLTPLFLPLTIRIRMQKF